MKARKKKFGQRIGDWKAHATNDNLDKDIETVYDPGGPDEEQRERVLGNALGSVFSVFAGKSGDRPEERLGATDDLLKSFGEKYEPVLAAFNSRVVPGFH